MGHTVYDGGQSISRRDLITRASGLAVAAVVPGSSAVGEQVWVGAAQASFPRKNDFTIPEGVTYLNGAYMHPMPNDVRDAVRDYNDRRGGFTTQTSADPDFDINVKADFAALINANTSEISYIPNTTTGEILIVHGLDIPRSGGNVVTDALHFESSIIHLQSLSKPQG